MAAKFICDACGKEEPAQIGGRRDWIKPSSWFQRADKDGIQDACSRACILAVAQRTGKTGSILPV